MTTPVYQQVHEAIVAAGPAGICAVAICGRMGITGTQFKNAKVMIRHHGLQMYALPDTRPEVGATYYATAEWLADDRQRREGAEKERLQQARAARRAERNAAKPARAPKLHAIGTHMPALQRNGVPVTKHQATNDRQRHSTAFSAQPADYSRAKITIVPTSRDTRFTAEGPVFSVLNPNDCRPWARAATAAKA